MTDSVTVLYIRKQVIKFNVAISVIVSTDAVRDGTYQKREGKTVRVSCSVFRN
jgi:hypothetical protein